MRRSTTLLERPHGPFLALLAVLFSAAFSKGQTAAPTVVASAGGFGASASASVSWTLGELAVETRGGGAGGIFTQGFQQPEPSGTISTAEKDALFESLRLFPNPAETTVSLAFSTKKTFSMRWEIVDEQGRSVIQSEKIDAPEGDFLQSIDLGPLAAGAYFLGLKKDGRMLDMARLVKI